jgi:zinc transporter, ZIP family
MSDLASMITFTLAAGACIPLGGLIASMEHLRPAWLENEFRHFVVAFGGGVLLAAVALVLLPEGIALVPRPLEAVLWFLGGGVLFFAVERHLGLQQKDAPQMMAMLLDFVPESLALGGLFITGSTAAPLLAVLVGLQNLPEGFNAYRELRAKGVRAARVLWSMVLLALLGPLLGLSGWYVLSDFPHVLGAVMLVSSGGLLYLVFQDIAPQAQLRRHWFPALGAVCGFGVALAGQLLFGS